MTHQLIAIPLESLKEREHTKVISYTTYGVIYGHTYHLDYQTY